MDKWKNAQRLGLLVLFYYLPSLIILYQQQNISFSFLIPSSMHNLKARVFLWVEYLKIEWLYTFSKVKRET